MSKKLIGLSCGDLERHYGITEALEICAKAGFDAVDFNLEPFSKGLLDVYTKSDEEIVDYFSKVKKRADELGLMISQTHGLCSTNRPDDEAYNEWVFQATRRDLLATSVLGAPACVIHSISTSRWLGATAEEMHKVCNEMYSRVIPFAEEYGVKVALETFGDCNPGGVRHLDFFGDDRELKKQYDSLNTKNKTLCMDTGHSHKSHDFDPSLHDAADAIRYLGSDITLLHLHDNNGFTDQHLPPMFASGSAQLDWKEVFAALDEIEYNGVYNFEIIIKKLGSMMDETTLFLGKFLRRFVNGAL